MSSKKILEFILGLIIVLQFNLKAQSESYQITWNLDNTDKIGGYSVSPLNTLPSISESKGSKYLLFNGVDNALLIKGNPLGTTQSFTIEVIIRPDSSFNPANLEQRYLHIGKTASDKERILLELRLLKNQKWAADVFVGSENSSLTFLDTVHSEHLHPAGKWYNIALVYENSRATSYINGIKDTTDKVIFHSLSDANISIGARQNPRSWFKGGIKTIRFTNLALVPAEFLKADSDQVK